MKKMIPAVFAAGLLFAACYHDPYYHDPYYPGYSGYYGPDYVVAPALPTIVYLETEPYYYHGGYHYHYRGNSWYYSKSRRGPWAELPRDRHPKETRWKGRDRHDDREWRKKHDEERREREKRDFEERHKRERERDD